MSCKQSGSVWGGGGEGEGAVATVGGWRGGEERMGWGGGRGGELVVGVRWWWFGLYYTQRYEVRVEGEGEGEITTSPYSIIAQT